MVIVVVIGAVNSCLRFFACFVACFALRYVFLQEFGCKRFFFWNPSLLTASSNASSHPKSGWWPYSVSARECESCDIGVALFEERYSHCNSSGEKAEKSRRAVGPYRLPLESRSDSVLSCRLPAFSSCSLSPSSRSEEKLGGPSRWILGRPRREGFYGNWKWHFHRVVRSGKHAWSRCFERSLELPESACRHDVVYGHESDERLGAILSDCARSPRRSQYVVTCTLAKHDSTGNLAQHTSCFCSSLAMFLEWQIWSLAHCSWYRIWGAPKQGLGLTSDQFFFHFWANFWFRKWAPLVTPFSGP